MLALPSPIVILIALVSLIGFTGLGYWKGHHDASQSYERALAQQSAEASKLLADSEAKNRALEQSSAKQVNQLQGKLDDAQSQIGDYSTRLKRAIADKLRQSASRQSCANELPDTAGNPAPNPAPGSLRSLILPEGAGENLADQSKLADDISNQLRGCQVMLMIDRLVTSPKKADQTQAKELMKAMGITP